MMQGTMSDSEMTPDEFDAALEEIPIEKIEIPPTRKTPTPTSVARQLIVNPEVARELVAGTSIRELAQQLGVSQQQIRHAMKRFDMADLLEIEARRVVRHLSRRDLSKEKYLGLATAAAVLLDKVERLKNGVQSPVPGTINQTFYQNITVGLFGRKREGTSESVGELDSQSSGTGQDAIDVQPDEAGKGSD